MSFALSLAADWPFPGLLSQTDRPSLPYFVTCSLSLSLSCLGPSFSSPLPVSREISSSVVCVGFAPKQTKRLSGSRQHERKHIVSHNWWLWKTLTAQIREIYNSLIRREIFPNDLKGYRKGTRGKKEQLYIDQYIFKESKTRRKSLAMVWIDYKKAYERIPQIWIVRCLKMYKIPEYVLQFI